MTDPLFCDVYPGDGTKDWNSFIAAGPPWYGAVFKLTQGLDYEYSAWAGRQRAPFVASPRYGTTLFDGFYHYLTFHQDGAEQATRFWAFMQRIGGELPGTMWAMVDVERGGQRIMNPSRRLVEDTVLGFALQYHKLSGRDATLYGGELLRSVGIKGRLGCRRSAVALYARELHGSGENTQAFLRRTGTDLEHLFLWQYSSADNSNPVPTNYPTLAPGCGKVDISAMVMPGGIEKMRSQLWAERPVG